MSKLLLSGAFTLFATAAAAWPTSSGNPLVVSNASTNQTSPSACSDGAGGAFIVWSDLRGSNQDLYAQHLDPEGNPLWGTAPDGGPDGLVLVGAPGNQHAVQIIDDGAGGFFAGWVDDTGAKLKVQRFDANHTELWPAGGITLGDGEVFQLLPDGLGGLSVAYQYGAGSFVSAAHLSASGTVLYNGSALNGTSGQARNPRAAVDGAGSALVVFQTLVPYEIRVQQVNPSGALLWGSTGLKVPAGAGVNGAGYAIASDGQGGALLVYCATNGQGQLYFEHVYADGGLEYPSDGGTGSQGVAVRTSSSTGISNLDGIADLDGGFFVGWFDGRNGTLQPFAQRLTHDGVSLWAAEGLQVSTDNAHAFTGTFQTLPGGDLGVIWGRISNNGAGAQRIAPDGSLRFQYNGVDLVTSHIATNGRPFWDSNGALLTFDDYTGSGSHIYAARIQADGGFGGTPDAGGTGGGAGGGGGSAAGGGSATGGGSGAGGGAGGDFSVAVDPMSGTVAAGGTAAFTVTTALTSGSAQSIVLSTSGLPASVAGSFDPPAVMAGQTSTLTVVAGDAAALGSSSFSVLGTSGSTVHPVTVSLEVAAAGSGGDFGIDLSPMSAKLGSGQQTAITVNTTVVSGTPSTIALTASGLPTGVLGSFSPATVTAGQSSTLTLSAVSTIKPADVTLTVTGTAGSTHHEATAPLKIFDSAEGCGCSSPGAAGIGGVLLLLTLKRRRLRAAA